MRFHCGISFRLKSLKRFLLPFLIGILAYFGLGSVLQVHAYSNYNTYYNFIYEDTDLYQFDNENYNFDDIFSHLTQYSDYYSVVVRYYPQNGSMFAVLIPKQYSSINVRIWGYSSSLPTQLYSLPSGTLTTSIRTIDPNIDNTEVLSYIDNCLQNGCVADNVNATTTTDVDFKVFSPNTQLSINNNDSYDLILDYSYTLFSNIDIKYTNSSISDNSSRYFKEVRFNDIIINEDEYVLTYCNLYNCFGSSGGGSTLPNTANYFDDIFVSNIDLNNLSTTEIDWSYQFIDYNFAISHEFQYFFYGRVDHGTYYSYEKINCNYSHTNQYVDEDTFTAYRNLTDISCPNTSNYDSLYIRIRQSNFASGTNHLINNLTYYTNNGYIGQSPIPNGDNQYKIMEHFSYLPSDFNILLSTTENLDYATYFSENKNIFISKVDRFNNRIDNLASGQEMPYGTYDNTNLVFYNFKPNYDNITQDLYIFFDDNNIVSVGDSNNDYYYYDSNNNLTHGVMNNDYQSYVNDSYNIDSFFDTINNFLYDIQDNLSDFHTLINEFYIMIPFFFKSFIYVLFVLGLVYVIFRELRS